MKQINNRGSDISRFLAKSLSYSVVGYDYHTIDLLLKEITLSEEVDYAKVADNKGKILSQSGTLVNNSKQMRLYSEKIILDNEVLGALTLGLNTSIAHDYISEQRNKLLRREIFITLVILVGEFFALSFLIIKPVSLISESLTTNAEDDTAKEINLKSDDEFGHLAQQFNNLNKKLNMANLELQHRVDFADRQLRDNVKELKKQKAELTRVNERFLKLSVTDSLTNLYNRRYFEEQLTSEIKLTERHNDTVSIILLDIDHFKNVNDSYGHLQGDQVLKHIAEAINNRMRRTDIVCRIGGEEFVVICKRTDKDTALELAENLRNTVEYLVIPIKEYKVSVTISIGIVTLTSENYNTHADNLYRFADLALYYSKEHGRNKVTHYDNVAASKQQHVF